MYILDSPFDSPIQVEEIFLLESEENIGLVSSRGTGVLGWTAQISHWSSDEHDLLSSPFNFIQVTLFL